MRRDSPKAIITVVGQDTIGIVAQVANLLASSQINILDIRQSTAEGLFNMFMLVDLEKSPISVADLSDKLKKLGERIGQEIHVQDERVIRAMHRI